MTTETLRTGSDALLVYPEGDADQVTILALNRTFAEVRLPGGTIGSVPIESIGIGVNDDIAAVFDDGSTWPPTRCPVTDPRYGQLGCPRNAGHTGSCWFTADPERARTALARDGIVG